MKYTDRIDVLIPAFNAAATIESSLASILRQTHENLRLIVVDDGSNDGTADILRRMKDQDQRLEFVSTPNGGIVSALNIALSLSDSAIIARHDADDIAHADRLERQLDYLNNNLDCVAVSANARQINARGDQIGITDFDGDVRPDADAIPSVEPYLMHPLLLARRHALDAVGGYRYALHCEDADLYWRLIDQGRLYNLPDVLGDYRIHEGGVSSASVQNGRVGAVYSQLATLSYRRRKHGQRDLPFPAAALHETKTLQTLGDLIAYVSPNLDQSEIAHLSLSSAAKLLENAVYRQYLLEEKDCRDIAKALRVILKQVPEEHRRKLKLHRLYVARRLLKAGKWKEYRALGLPPSEHARVIGAPLRQRLSRAVRLRRA